MSSNNIAPIVPSLGALNKNASSVSSNNNNANTSTISSKAAILQRLAEKRQQEEQTSTKQQGAIANEISKSTTTTTTAPSFSTLSVLPTEVQLQQGPRSVLTCVWRCGGCGHDCAVIRSENRCICGHRSKEHQMDLGAGKARCKAAGCKCKCFFYIFGEGSFMLRCRCKHKHNEHDCNPPYKCLKPNCKTCPVPGGFDSPFVCNCNCGWAQHSMVWEMRQLKELPRFDNFGDPAIVKRGLDDDE